MTEAGGVHSTKGCGQCKVHVQTTWDGGTVPCYVKTDNKITGRVGPQSSKNTALKHSLCSQMKDRKQQQHGVTCSCLSGRGQAAVCFPGLGTLAL